MPRLRRARGADAGRLAVVTDPRRSPEVDLARAATPRLLGLIWYFLSRQVISQIFLPVRLRDGFTT